MDSKLIDRLRELPVAALYEAAGRTGALPPVFRPVTKGLSLAGPAFTVLCKGESNLAIHGALYAASPGDILVIATDAASDCAYIGELMAEAAAAGGLGGILLDGRVRDLEVLAGLDIPIYCRGGAARGPTKERIAGDGLLLPVRLGHSSGPMCYIHPGDFIRADADGALVLPKDRLAGIPALAEERLRQEADILLTLQRGRTPLFELLGVDLGGAGGGAP
ncbi:MAG: hypothetical protein V3R73_05895 [Sphingomonadales bacterium]